MGWSRRAEVCNVDSVTRRESLVNACVYFRPGAVSHRVGEFRPELVFVLCLKLVLVPWVYFLSKPSVSFHLILVFSGSLFSSFNFSSVFCFRFVVCLFQFYMCIILLIFPYVYFYNFVFLSKFCIFISRIDLYFSICFVYLIFCRSHVR